MNNYAIGTHSIVFFDDRDALASARCARGARAVWRRPSGKAWKNVPQIMGEYACAVGDLARHVRAEPGPSMPADECSCPQHRRAG